MELSKLHGRSDRLCALHLDGRLVAVDLFRAPTEVHAALTALSAIEQRLSETVGALTEQYGERAPSC